jgi:hypothetical protein
MATAAWFHRGTPTEQPSTSVHAFVCVSYTNRSSKVSPLFQPPYTSSWWRTPNVECPERRAGGVPCVSSTCRRHHRHRHAHNR